ncbi:MAG: OmpA family protein [Cyclobacteriaceae bacterium]|nr:OmpA family protein [Cyclobacteriaceae bacterium]
MNKLLFLVTVIISVGMGDVFAQSKMTTSNINSIYDEQSPVVSPDGKHLFYTIAHNENNSGGMKDKGDIWYAIWQDSVWSIPFHGGSVINNKGWNGVIGFSEDGSLYLHHHYKDGKQGVSIAKKKGDYWEKPVNVDVPYFMNKSSQQSGSISADGQVMLLSLESYGSIGAEDIYILFKEGDSFTDPKNLGSVINTRFQEMTPTLSADNKTLYFSSNGLNGKGSMDIYSSTRLDDTWKNWSKPVNIEEVNTEGREVSFNFNPLSNTAWYVSTKDSDGYGDIKYKTIESLDDTTIAPLIDSLIIENVEPIVADIKFVEDVMFYGKISNAIGKATIGAKISITHIETGEMSSEYSDEITGKYELLIPKEGKYSVKVSSANYLPHIDVFYRDSTTININIDYELIPVKIGEAVQLDNVLFERGKAVMLPASFPDLDAVTEMMLDNLNMEIVLAGHTDNQGSSKLNYQLSEQRVEAVMKYIVDKGISKKRITGKGYGGSRPIANNTNPETRKLNRRVEFTIVKE